MSKANKFWRQVELNIRERLRSEGHSRAVAKYGAAFEVRQRRLGEHLIGREAAATEELRILLRQDGSYSTWLAVRYSAIPKHLRARAEAWAAGPEKTCH